MRSAIGPNANPLTVRSLGYSSCTDGVRAAAAGQRLLRPGDVPNDGQVGGERPEERVGITPGAWTAPSPASSRRPA